MVLSYLVPCQFDGQIFKLKRHLGFNSAVKYWRRVRPNGWVRFISTNSPISVDLFFDEDGVYHRYEEFLLSPFFRNRQK